MFTSYMQRDNLTNIQKIWFDKFCDKRNRSLTYAQETCLLTILELMLDGEITDEDCNSLLGGFLIEKSE